MPRVIRFLFLSMLSLAGGCATAERRQSTAEVSGLHDEERETRLLSVARRCEPHFLVGNCRYEILVSSNAGAFAWPDGRILITRGLIDLLNDEELAAAIAHEIGHLLADGHVAGRFSLDGSSGAKDVEGRADSLGCQLLAEAGVPTQSMTSLLGKLALTPGLTHCQRAAVKTRIVNLHAAPSGAPVPQK